MKKLYRPLCFVAAVAAMSLTSCQKENFNPAGEGETVTITVHANVEEVANATKTHIEGQQVLWDENEEMKVIAFNNANPENTGSESVSTEFTPSADFTTATFKATVNAEKNPDRIAGVYPKSAAVGLGSTSGKEVNATSYKVELSAAQSATANSYDPSTYIMIAHADNYPLENNEWTAYYKRATALNQMILSGITDDIKSVTITFPEGQQAAGRRYFNLATGEAGEIYHGQTNTVTVNYATPLKAGNGENDVWFTSWNANVKTGEAITVKAESATKIYTKTLTATKEVALMENYLNIFPFDMTGAEVEEIAPVDDLSGDYLIIAQNGNWSYMGDYNSKGYHNEVKTSVSTSREFNSLTAGDFIGAEQYIWTVSKVDGGYTIQNTQGEYLSLPNDNKTGLSQSQNAETLEVSVNEDATWTIRGNYANRKLTLNPSATRFANYQDSFTQGKPVYLLPWVESTEPVLIVSETSKTVAADAAEVVFEYTARNLTGAVTATVASDESQIISGSPVVDAAASTVTVTLNPNTEEVEKTATITISANTVGVEDQTLTIIQQAYAPLADIVLTFPDDNKDNNKCSAYNKSWTAISGSHEFNIENFNNYNWNNWTYIRCGSRNDASVGTISNVTSMPKIASIAVTVDKITTTEVNSIFLSIYSDEGLATQIGSNIAPNEGITSGTLTFNIPAEYQVSNQYYELSFDCQKGKSNGIIQISKVEYAVTE